MVRNSPGGRERDLLEGYAAWVGPAILFTTVVLAVLRGWYAFALVAVCTSVGLPLGRALGKALARISPGFKTSVASVASLAVACLALAVAGFGGVLPLQYRGVGLWGPLLALLLPALGTAAFRVWAEREHRHEAEKLEMMLDLYPHPDGGRWDGEKIEAATGGELSRETFEDLRGGRGAVIGVLGLDLDEAAALAVAIDFPLELWYRKLGWWEGVHEDWRRGADVSDKLQEWDCVTPERAAERLDVSPDDVLRMVRLGELEGRQNRDGEWQIREHGVFERELQKSGKPSDLLPPHPRNARPGRTGTGNYLDRSGRPF